MITAYAGNGAYCYANSTSMLLAAIGENISPETIEVLSGVGLGAFWFPEDRMLYFSNAVPHRAVSRAMELLGFETVQNQSAGIDELHAAQNLRTAIGRHPVMLGPLDMGDLSYMPGRSYLRGCDHYVLAFEVEGDAVRLHDPAGYPYAEIPVEELVKAGRTDRLQYRPYPRELGCHFWSEPKRVHRPAPDEIYRNAVAYFREIYADGRTSALYRGWLTGDEAIEAAAECLASGDAEAGLQGHLTHFAFPVGARRAIDYGKFFRERNGEWAGLKMKQAEAFGRCHALAVGEKWTAVASALGEIAELERKFQASLLEE